MSFSLFNVTWGNS